MSTDQPLLAGNVHTECQHALASAETDLSRRRVLQAGLGAGVLAAGTFLAPSPLWASVPVPNHEKRVQLRNIHTDETVTDPYYVDGKLVPETLESINYLLRDSRTGTVKDMDVNLLELLTKLQVLLQYDGEFLVTSGYRTPRSNARLRSEGAAKHSMHVKGRAIDIRVPGRKLSDVRLMAVGLRAGGVGYYPRSNFVHLDTGRLRYW